MEDFRNLLTIKPQKPIKKKNVYIDMTGSLGCTAAIGPTL